MIRFIDLGKQIGVDDLDWPREFAFYSTITERFIEDELFGLQTWSSWEDFSSTMKNQVQLERYKSLCPDWVFEDGKK